MSENAISYNDSDITDITETQKHTSLPRTGVSKKQRNIISVNHKDLA